jgi:hypothetical protein
LTPEERAQLHRLFDRMHPQVPSQQANQSIGTPQPSQPSLQLSSSTVSTTGNMTPHLSSMALPQPSMTQLPSTPLTTPVHHQYQSARGIQGTSAPLLPSAPYGHPSSISAGGPSQPFLGLHNIGLSMAGQVNQQRRASAAHHSSAHQLQTRGRRRGPAIRPPTLPRSSRVEDCLSVTGTTTGNIRLKVKIYPPQVSNPATLSDGCSLT